MFNSYVSLPEGIRPTLYHGQNMATHKFNTGTPWKSMQFTHPHVSKYFLYGHNKGYQHVSTTTSPPCQAMLNHPKSPIDQYIHHQIFFIQSFIHVIPTMNWSLAPLYPRSQPPTVQQHPLGPPNTSSVAFWVWLLGLVAKCLACGLGRSGTFFWGVKVLLFCRCSLGAIEGWSGVPVDWSRIRQNQFMGLI